MFTFTLFLSVWARILLPLLYPEASAAAISVARTDLNSPTENSTSETVIWSTDRRLSWDDFKGLPDDTNPHHALTAANLAVNAGCKNNQYTYKVKCVFLPQQSWSKKKSSDKLLAHEQLHFDLTEVHARQLRHDLQTISCSNLKAKLGLMVNEAFKRWKAEQDLFDQASKHGLDKDEQQAWAASIAARLKKLEAYQ
ncbi:DUF922 domain-containing protein [Pontibacter anaerobius]|uniref:DUF922 domain-containing protein n=1 Tax=Pontibacter anaerobius TaxID=2993940 RepID=A0ABT3RJ16_9BACT|nr:DUF922 domain-containing protein [Pontibacter anaerobius]MCX2741848.1 DUF922 domain-containing protein [Pontibacter anaerobius]